MLLITVVSGPDAGRVFRLPLGTSHTIGRHHGSVSLEDSRVSRRHAKIRPATSGAGYTLTDLGSSNGTAVNNQPISTNTTPLNDGDRIQVGKSVMTFAVVADAGQGDAPGLDLEPSAGQTQAGGFSHDLAPAIHAQQQMLSDIREGLTQLSEKVAQPPTAAPAHADDTFVRRQLAQILEQLDDMPQLRAPLSSITPTAEPTDLSPVLQKLDEVLKASAAAGEASLQRAVSPSPAPTDLTPVLQKLDEVLKASRAPAPPAPVAPPADLSPLAAKLDDLQTALRSAPKPESLDLAPLSQKLDQVIATLRETPKPAPQAAPTDLAPVNEKLDDVIATLRSVPQPTEPDLAPLAAKLDQLLTAFRAVTKPAEPNLAPLTGKLDQVIAAVEKTPAPPQASDLGPLTAKLDEVLTALKSSPKTEPKLASTLSGKLDQVLVAVEKAPQPQAIDLSPLALKLDEVLTALRTPAPVAPPAPAAVADLSPITAKLEEVAAAIQKLPAPEKPADHGPLLERIRKTLEAAPPQDIAATLCQITFELQKITQRDLAPQIAELSNAIESLPVPQIILKLEELAQAGKKPIIADPKVVDQLTALQTALSELPKQLDTREAIQQLRTAVEALPRETQPVAQKLDELRSDISKIDARGLVHELRKAIESLPREPLAPKLQELRTAIDAIGEASLQRAVSPPLDPASLNPITQKLDEILASLHQLPAQSAPAADTMVVVEHPEFQAAAQQLITLLSAKPDTELQIIRRLDEIAETQSKQSAVAPAAAPATDTELLQQVTAVRAAVSGLPSQMDLREALTPVVRAVESLASKSVEVSLPDFGSQLTQITQKLEALSATGESAALIAQIKQSIEAVAPVQQQLAQKLDVLLEAAKKPAGDTAALQTALEELPHKLAEPYHKLQTQLDEMQEAQWAAQAANVETDLLADLRATVDALSRQVEAGPRQVDQSVSQFMAALQTSQADLKSLHEKLAAVSLVAPAAGAAPQVAELEKKFDAILKAIAAQPAKSAATSLDAESTALIKEIRQRITAIETRATAVVPESAADIKARAMLAGMVEVVQDIRQRLVQIESNTPDPSHATPVVAAASDAVSAEQLKPMFDRLSEQLAALPDRVGEEQKTLAEIFTLVRGVEAHQERDAERLRRSIERIEKMIEQRGVATPSIADALMRSPAAEIEPELETETAPIDYELERLSGRPKVGELRTSRASLLTAALIAAVMAGAGVMVVKGWNSWHSETPDVTRSESMRTAGAP